jgi:two-component system CheB/CheR fusion protein
MAKQKSRPRRHPHRKPASSSAAPAARAEAAASPPRSEELPTIVAVGASAGGLEAFSQVLEHIQDPPDVAFVFVQHLSPQHSSALPELLSGKTKLPVITATDGARVAANKVYVIPPNVQLEVRDGHLHLMPRPTDRSQYTPIDFFFQSVARLAQDRTIGVVLSGTASDGAAGIREIKACGGITIAQRPETARHDGMPRAAIATGMVDLVLSPPEIAEQLKQFRWHPYILHKPTQDGSEITLTDAELRELFFVLRRASGIDFKQYKTPTVKRRLLRRMALLRLTSVDSYIKYITDHSTEAKALGQDLLIHVTRFFRDPDAFAALSNEVFDTLLERSDDSIRIWVPGCATGEEAYSVAICLVEQLGDRLTERRVQIFATDVSDSAIDQARTGTFPLSIAADVSAERLKRFFTKVEDGYRIVKMLRDMCVFARHDLTRDPPFSRLDVIVCRNVLIYLDLPMQKRLIGTFHYALKTHGYLMLGPAETAGPVGYFNVADKKWRIFARSTHQISPPPPPPPDPVVAVATASPIPRQRPVPVEVKSAHEEATRLMLDRYAPAGVIVDSGFQIVQFRGHTGRFLEAATGEPNLNVLKMARSGLLYPLRSALQAAHRRKRPIKKDRVTVQFNGDWIQVSVEVLPLTTARGDHYLVLFDDAAPAPKARKAAAARVTKSRGEDVRLTHLRRELGASREYLQSIIQELEAANEELQSANEEILSANEELQSTNEELDTAKEELQSTNEELNTVNEELHSRNEELTRVNSDLVNLLGSVDIPIVIVGGGLEIRRFTPRAEQMFNLIPGDVGRPIAQINPNFEVDDLPGLIQATIDDIAPHEREVRDKSGRWYALRVRPYRAVDNRLDGAVIAAIDIDAAKRYEDHVARSTSPVAVDRAGTPDGKA